MTIPPQSHDVNRIMEFIKVFLSKKILEVVLPPISNIYPWAMVLLSHLIDLDIVINHTYRIDKKKLIYF
jgi:hypothetical protein